MKKLLLIFLPYFCFAQTFKGIQTTQGTTFTYKANELFESFPNSQGSNPVQNAVPNGWLAWFDPNVNITIETGVSSWCDISGTYCFIQGTGANQPTYVSGARPYLNFDGSNDVLNITGFGGVGTYPEYTVIAITSPNTVSANGVIYLYEQTLGNGFFDIIRTNSNQFKSEIQMTSYQSTLFGSYSVGSTYMVGVEINRGIGRRFIHSSSTYRLSSVNITTALTNWSSQTTSIGGYSGGFYNNSKFYDIIIYPRALTQAEYSSLYNYFKAKYNLL